MSKEFDFQTGGGKQIPVTTTITEGRLWDQLTSALEGGSNYWIRNVKKVDQNHLTDKPTYLQDWPFLGGALIITLGEDPGGGRPMEYRLDYAALLRGVEVMQNLKKGEGGHHWADVVNESGDATTGDVFLQCCIFGEIIFG